MDLREFNKKSNTGMDYFNFNCGGFALGTFDWYEPIDYEWLANEGPESYTLGTILAKLANNILDDFPFLEVVSNPDQISSDKKIIGFRLEVSDDYAPCECCESEDNRPDCEACSMQYSSYQINDFHFVVRWEGEWYHKVGAAEIEILPIEPWENWESWHYSYNSDIIWFVDPTAEIWHGYS